MQISEKDRDNARSAVVSAYHALDCVSIPVAFLHAFADAAVSALSTDAEPVKTAPAVAVKAGLVTPQMLIDTACWCQDEQELRDTLKMAAAALSAQVQDVAETDAVAALKEAEPYVEICHSLMTSKDTRANVWRVLKQVRAAIAASPAPKHGEEG